MKRTTKPVILLLVVTMILALIPSMTSAADVEIVKGIPTFAVNMSNSTVIGFGGKQWVVIGYDGSGVASQAGTLTLLAKNDDFGTTKFHINQATPSYVDSGLHLAMQRVHSSITNLKEQKLVIPRDIDVNDGKSGTTTLTDQYFWPLSIIEANSLDSTLVQFPSSWWLRSPGEGVFDASVVHVFNHTAVNVPAFIIGSTTVYSTYAVRPTFLLDLSQVIFAFTVSGKSSVTLASGLVTTASFNQNTPKKFAVQSANLNLSSSVTDVGTVKAGDVIEIPYSRATIGENNYVSGIIENNSGEVLFYGKMADAKLIVDVSGTASFVVPSTTNLPDGAYTVRIFVEEENRGNYTDFCSTPLAIRMVVDNTAPVLTDHGVDRLDETEAEVSFSSDKDGMYYHTVVLKGSPLPFIDTSGLGTPCTAGIPCCLSLTGLNNGAYDFYTIVKDTVGNVSDPIKISIPAWEYTLTVVNGQLISGGIRGSFPEGTLVSVVAEIFPPNHIFSHWSSNNGGNFDTPNDLTAKFTMPAGNTTVTANWEFIPSTITTATTIVVTTSAPSTMRSCVATTTITSAELATPITQYQTTSIQIVTSTTPSTLINSTAVSEGGDDGDGNKPSLIYILLISGVVLVCLTMVAAIVVSRKKTG